MKDLILDGLHDVMVDVLENRKYSDEEVLSCFASLPYNIQIIAHEWGGLDTVFCDEAYRFLQGQKR